MQKDAISQSYKAELVLSQVGYLEIKIKQIQTELNSLKARAGLSSCRLDPTGVSGSKSNTKTANIVCAIIECEQELSHLQLKHKKAEKIVRRLLRKAPISSEIHGMFLDRFIHGFKWRDVMARAGVSKTYMYKKRREGLNTIQEFINQLNI